MQLELSHMSALPAVLLKQYQNLSSSTPPIGCTNNIPGAYLIHDLGVTILVTMHSKNKNLENADRPLSGQTTINYSATVAITPFDKNVEKFLADWFENFKSPHALTLPAPRVFDKDKVQILDLPYCPKPSGW